MPTKTSTVPAKTKIDPVAVTTALMEETPELAQPLLARGVIEKAGDGTISISGTTETIHKIGTTSSTTRLPRTRTWTRSSTVSGSSSSRPRCTPIRGRRSRRDASSSARRWKRSS